MPNYMDYDDNELTRYTGSKKYKRSPKKKSNHKHNYLPCIVESVLNAHLHYGLGKYCDICGKVQMVNYFITVKEPGRPFSRMVSGLSEIKGLYPDYPVLRETEK